LNVEFYDEALNETIHEYLSIEQNKFNSKDQSTFVLLMNFHKKIKLAKET
jgi:hypothetical protein